MGVRWVVCLVAVVLGVCVLTQGAARIASSPCLQDLPGVTCRCYHTLAFTNIECSCLPFKTLDLRDLRGKIQPFLAAAFHLRDCWNTSVLVFPDAFDTNNLIGITFNNIHRLTFDPNSINISPLHFQNFTLIFSFVTNLSIRKDAITINLVDYENIGVKLKISQTSIISLMKSAITGNLKEVHMKEVFLKIRPWPGAVRLGSGGANVIMESVTTKKGLSGEWITGNVSHLSITDSHLKLLPRAFDGLEVSTTPAVRPAVTLLRNNLLTPFLPTRALPSGGLLLKAKDNYITCECQNLAWLLEPPDNKFKKGIKASLKCRGKSPTSVLPSCNWS